MLDMYQPMQLKLLVYSLEQNQEDIAFFCNSHWLKVTQGRGGRWNGFKTCWGGMLAMPCWWIHFQHCFQSGLKCLCMIPHSSEYPQTSPHFPDCQAILHSIFAHFPLPFKMHIPESSQQEGLRS